MSEILANTELLSAAAGLVAVLYGMAKGSEWYERRASRRMRIIVAIADKAVAWVWARYMRDRVDEAKAKGEPVHKNVEKLAQEKAIELVRTEAKLYGLETDPAIEDLDGVTATVEQAVKRFKNGRGGLYSATKSKRRGVR